MAVAERALAFGMKVLAYDVIPIKTDLAVKQVPLDELLAAGGPHHPPRPQAAQARSWARPSSRR